MGSGEQNSEDSGSLKKMDSGSESLKKMDSGSGSLQGKKSAFDRMIDPMFSKGGEVLLAREACMESLSLRRGGSVGRNFLRKSVNSLGCKRRRLVRRSSLEKRVVVLDLMDDRVVAPFGL